MLGSPEGGRSKGRGRMAQEGREIEKDGRVQWLDERVATTLGVQRSAMREMVDIEGEGAEAVSSFLDDEESSRLFVSCFAKGELAASHSPPAPASGARRSAFFLKRSKTPLSNESIASSVLFGDLSDPPLHHLNALCEHVFLPLLTNPKNTQGWPEVVSKDVTQKLHQLLASVQVTIGNTKGQTLLPLPPVDMPSESSRAFYDKDRVHVLEATVTTWTREIKAVLRREPDQALKEGHHPGPLTELDFWANKASSLNAIHDQLVGNRIRKVARILELSKSTYYPAFTRLCREVGSARVEANENSKFLEPLRKHLDKLSRSSDPSVLVGTFKPFWHIVLLIWKESPHYNQPSRVVILVREVCNALISQTSRYVASTSVLDMEPGDAIDKLQKVIQVCNTFKAQYYAYKERAAEECPYNPWRFQHNALFARLESFIERCQDVLDLMQTISQFNKLEKMEIGGTRGKALTDSVRQIHSDFQQAADKFHHVDYSLVDIERGQFDDDFYAFRSVIKELERRLASIITQAFDECSTVTNAFKLLDSFEGLLERELIQANFEKKHIELVRAFCDELRTVKQIFHNQKGSPNISKNAPPHSGAVKWMQSLIDRVEEPMQKIRGLSNVILETEEAQEAKRLYETLISTLKEHKDEEYHKWCRLVENHSEEKLKQHLLVKEERDGVEVLSVNLDPELVTLLREIRYFYQMGVEMPEEAKKLHKRSETLRQQTSNLELIVGTYNEVLTTMLDVERSLVSQKVENTEQAFSKGLSVLTWNSYKIDDYLQELMALVKDLDKILKTVKGNVSRTQSIIANWQENPIFSRKECKTYCVEEFKEEHESLVSVRHNEIKEGAEEIKGLIASSNKALKISKGSPSWKAYVEYVSDIVSDGFVRTCLASLSHLRQHLDPQLMSQNESPPLLEISLELRTPEILWSPELGETNDASGVRDHFNSWITSILRCGSHMARLDHNDETYEAVLSRNQRVQEEVSELQEMMDDTQQRCEDFRKAYFKYDFLWNRDLNEVLQTFLNEHSGSEGRDIPLHAFDEQIAYYRSVQDEVSALPPYQSIRWIKIDARPIKQALSTLVTKWIFLFTQHLTSKVTLSLEELNSFINDAFRVLNKDPNEAEADFDSGGDAEGDEVEDEKGDKAANAEMNPNGQADTKSSTVPSRQTKRSVLYEIMSVIRSIKQRSESIESTFKPLQETMELLQRYGVALSDKTLQRLDECPQRWEDLKQRTVDVREELASLQKEEGSRINLRSEEFASKVGDFRRNFLSVAPHDIRGDRLQLSEVDAALERIEMLFDGSPGDVLKYGGVERMLDQGRELNDHQELFELNVSDHSLLEQSLAELKALKEFWHTARELLETFSSWKGQQWSDINVESLIDEAKSLRRALRGVDKNVRSFEVYRKLDEQVKSWITSLPLINELRSPAMRDRHWKQLMRATGRSLDIEESFTLGDLLSIDLHSYSEAVTEIVERANKELVIERGIEKIEENWASLALEFSAFEDKNVNCIFISDVIWETLENDSIQLQNMSGNRHVQGNEKFQEIVNLWLRKLSSVDAVLNTWQTVSHKWSMLEPVFSGSADIRQKLPDDSKRFDVASNEFQELMEKAPEVINVVKACTFEGREDKLNSLLEQLEQCEKSLQGYLETKRDAFPRFYFVAPVDLLDILSKGNTPQQIQSHLPKIFENIAWLDFKGEQGADGSKTAVGMHSKEGEHVEFAQNCNCEGQVEDYLWNVMSTMQNVVHTQMVKSIEQYERMARTSWVFQYCAQVAVSASRVMYTHEVNKAFQRFEEGNKNALKDLLHKQKDQLSDLIQVINGNLTTLQRKTALHLCTIDVHNRDILQSLVDQDVDSEESFQWQSQMRYLQDKDSQTVRIQVSDADIPYQYEYLGNTGCLVITPLTDRCYITLTQAQRLSLGGAPAGPAGTGKTETVKDLGKALATLVYVFNCSEQMDYKAMGQIYKGLAQTGAWGCFDEFNRIPVAVLSVCSAQYKTVLDAIRRKKERFMFEDSEIPLNRMAMAFITMNPGYPGRNELPESLKALFRPVSMIVPDLKLICENMLLGEGFNDAKNLARKFVMLYHLCDSLLSKSSHYDFGLRAIKTTLQVAGTMKRDQPELSEDKVLLQALRDFNLGKLTKDDMNVFYGLLNDLFPGLLQEVPAKHEEDFQSALKDAAHEYGFQTHENFMLKMNQLREIFTVRWTVFLLGPAGCGKTATWRTLMRAQNKHGEKSTAKPVNPKAVQRDELYGYLHPSTREWKDGVLSATFRDMAHNKTYAHQWILLDGDIDPLWIESMNTVMDDNKMLTLASNERIPLTDSMKLLMEVNHMRHCSPATVSRGGVVYINKDDIGYWPMIESWIESIESKEVHEPLQKLFSKYIDHSVEHCRRHFKTIVPLEPINLVSTVCNIMESLIPKSKGKDGHVDQKLLEYHFVYACVWGLGGAMLVDKVSDYRAAFSRWWTSTWKDVHFPDGGSVFDYYVNTEDCKMKSWSFKVPSFSYNTGEDFSSLFVPTLESTRLRYLLDLLVDNQKYVMFVGNAGTGKSALMREKLKSLDLESWTSSPVNCNNFMDQTAIQVILEQPLEKKSGERYGPVGLKRLVYFLDDLNMPYVDQYDTQTPLELARQFIDYGGWYNRNKSVLKQILNSQYVASMNQTAGSFTITPRLQRHFATMAVQMPSLETQKHIFSSIVEGHLASFNEDVQALGGKFVEATVDLHRHVVDQFVPSASKLHYQWNLRELSSIARGITRMRPEATKEQTTAVRLWFHEAERVYRDRLVSEIDASKFDKMLSTTMHKHFEEVDHDSVEERPLIFTDFMSFDNEDVGIYAAVDSITSLRTTLEKKLAEYNELFPAMDLVLFHEAMEHICRITRIIKLPNGNALLVGVGGSGKQSLARLAAYICGYELFQISVSSEYGIADFRDDLKSLYHKSGVRSLSMAFLLADNQIVDERMLVYLNDLLSSGNVPDLFTQDDKDQLIGGVRNEVKQAGIVDTDENCWGYFISKVRNNLHIILCLSPVGSTFRTRLRNFPAISNCTAIDWFQPWPHEALVSVASRFLSDIPDLDQEVRENIDYHMAFVHDTVGEASERFLEQERRRSYTTPKSYLELISLYKNLLTRERNRVQNSKGRLERGVQKISEANKQVEQLQENLKQEQEVVEEKKANTEALIESIGKEKSQVAEAMESSKQEEEETSKIQEEVKAQQEECDRELKKAEPKLEQAYSALTELDKKSLDELSKLGSPPSEVAQVVAACMVLTAPGGKVPKDLSWKTGRQFMGNADRFKKSLMEFGKEDNMDNIPEHLVTKVEKDYTSNKEKFNPSHIKTKSFAASGLCAWVRNIVEVYRIYQEVKPKREKLNEANEKLHSADAKLKSVQSHVQEMQERVSNLEEKLMHATEEKNNAVAQAERTKKKADLADRLVNGLSNEYERWQKQIEELKEEEGLLVGNVLLAASFVSYAGPFSAQFRKFLVEEKWLPDLLQRNVPISENASPLNTLAGPSERARWANEGLPSDQLSQENGAIVSTSARWPLLIDPQLQGSRWLKEREGDDLTIIQLSQKKWMDKLMEAIENGKPAMIESLSEVIDASLRPLLARQVSKRGKSHVLALGDKEVDYNSNFRLYLQTKLSNPHYKPEIAAQTCIINFCVTEQGLEDQLLARVVSMERPDLQAKVTELSRQLSQYTIDLRELEDSLLQRLASVEGDILDDTLLIENLESAKKTASDVQEKAKQANENKEAINVAREEFRPVATRGALIYFMINNLSSLDRVYEYSMENFLRVLDKGIQSTPLSDGYNDERVSEESGEVAEDSSSQSERVLRLMKHMSEVIFQYVSSGLFSQHKLTVAAQLCFTVLKSSAEVSTAKLDYLLRGPKRFGNDNPCSEWLSESSWASVQALADLESFESLPDDLVHAARRWRDWLELGRPEAENVMPGEWKRMPAFDQLLVYRAIRPDRLANAVENFVASTLGSKFIEPVSFDLPKALEDAGPSTPVFIFLSPGVDVAGAVEQLAQERGFTVAQGNYAAVSLGQGQESIAMEKLRTMHSNGGWLLLQNIHLTIDWSNGPLEEVVDNLGEGANENFQLFLSAEPPPSLEKGLAVSLLQNSVKLTNEPPTGLKASFIRAFSNFSDEDVENCSRQSEYKAIIFALSYFHAVTLERKKFGVGNLPNASSGIGWNMNYPFKTGDLLCSASIAQNYLERCSTVPWADLKYMVGEIMYGGHIVEEWDRRLASSYLETLLTDELLDGKELFPGFSTPSPALSHAQMLQHIEENFPTAESPLAYGLNPNAETAFRTRECNALCSQLISLQPREASSSEAATDEERAKQTLDDLMEKLPSRFDMEALRELAEGDSSPFISLAVQEADAMSTLLDEMNRTLEELDLGLKGDLTMTDQMESMVSALANDSVPQQWRRYAWPSLRPLGSWMEDLLRRVKQLDDWTSEMQMPSVVWLGGLFNPGSFITAVKQSTARRNEWPLDRVATTTEVTSSQMEEIEGPAPEGVYVTGLTLEGARIDERTKRLEDPYPKEMAFEMPVVQVKAVKEESAPKKNVYQCPVYRTERRFREEVFTAQLKTNTDQNKWVLQGVAIILDIAPK